MTLRSLIYVATFVLSLALVLYLTPIIRQGALSFGILDKPDGQLKRQSAPVPYLGGIAVYLSFLLTLSVVFEFNAQLLGLLLGATMIAMLGLFDDLQILAPRLKFAGQLLAAWVMLRSDIAIHLVSIPEAVAVLFSIFWLVGITNAVNLIDVSDGLATGVTAIAALGLFGIAVINGDTLIATTTLALVGSLIGFLKYNQAPAQIYLGDTGSLFIGFMLAALSMIGAYTEQNELAAIAPLFILAVPILETTLISLARLSRGHSPFQGSPDHMALRLKNRGWSSQKICWLAYALGILGSVTGLCIVVAPFLIAIISMSIVFILLSGVFLWLWRMPVASSE